MISSIMKYGGISAKVRAMYGKRLTRSDYEKLSGAKSVADIAAYLKSLPAWNDALKGIQPSTVHRGELEKALHESLVDEYVRIYQFMSRNDHPLMRYLIIRMELDEIFLFLRLLISGDTSSYTCSLPAFFRSHSSIKYDLFGKSHTFSDFLDCIKGSIYYKPLSGLPRKANEPPEFTLTKAVLSSEYYSEILHLVAKNYSGAVADKLEEGIGVQIDLTNIQTIIRIKSFFPKMSADAAQYLIPHTHLIRPPFLRSLLEASSVTETNELLKSSSPYSKLFASNVFPNLEDYQSKYLYDFNKRILSTAAPSVYTPIAYLSLKEIEIRNIVHIIECVRYGETPNSASVFITGM